MVALREIFAEYDVRFDPRRQIERGNRNVNQLTTRMGRLDRVVGVVSRSIGGLATQIAGAVGAAGLFQFVNGIRESSVELQRHSQRLGVNARQLRGWIAQARAAGADTDDLVDSMNDLQLRAQDAVSGGTEQAEMFERIGISLDDLRPRVNDAAALFEFFQQRLRQVNDEGMRRFTVDELMSDAGVRLIPMFERQTAELTQQRLAVEQSSDSILELGRRSMQLNRLVASASLRFEEFRATVALRFMPMIERVVTTATQLSSWFQKLTEDSRTFQNVLRAVGVVAAAVALATITAWGPVAAAILGAVGAVGILTVAFNDLEATLNKEESSTRRFIDSLFGVGTTTNVIADLTFAFRGLGVTIDWVGKTLNNVFASIDRNIQRLLGTIKVLAPIRRLFAADEGFGTRALAARGALGAAEFLPGIGGVARTLGGLDVLGRGVRRARTGVERQTQVTVSQNNPITVTGVATTADIDRRIQISQRQNNDELARTLQSALVTDQALATTGGTT